MGRRRHGGSEGRSGGAAIVLDGGRRRRVLQLMRSRVSGSISCTRSRAARDTAAHRRRLDDASSPALGTESAGVGDGSDEMEAKRSWKEDFYTPLPVMPNVGIGAPRTQTRFKLWGMCEDLTQPRPQAHHLMALPLRVRASGEGNEHRDLPRFGPPCGVKLYSCFVVDCLVRRLRMNKYSG